MAASSMKPFIMNLMMRQGINIPAYKGILPPNVILRIGGALAVGEDGYDITDTDIAQFAELGNPVIHVLNMQRTPEQQLDIISQLYYKGLLYGVEIGNEDYLKPVFTKGKTPEQLGRDDFNAYTERFQPFTWYLGVYLDKGAKLILQGAYAKNQLSSRINDYREAWTESCVSYLNGYQDASVMMSLHIYDSRNEKYDDFKFLEKIIKSDCPPLAITECSALSDKQNVEGETGIDPIHWQRRAQRTLREVSDRLRPTDLHGFHLVEHPKKQIGYMFQPTGDEMIKTQIGEYVDRIMEPRVANVIRSLPEHLTKPYAHVIVVLNTGQELRHKCLISDKPNIGDLWNI